MSAYKSDKKIRTMAAAGVFCALAYAACLVFHFRVSFLTFDLKDAVMTLGAMLFGPIYGFAMCVIVSLIEMVTISTTEFYGFIMNVLASVSFVCVGSAIYALRRTMRGALIGMLCSVLAMTAVMMAANLVITPFYMGVSASEVAKMIPTLLLPFNLTKSVFNAAVVFLLYKPVSHAIRAAGFTSEAAAAAPAAGAAAGEPRGAARKKSRVTPTVVISVLVAAAALAYFFLCLHGTFSFG